MTATDARRIKAGDTAFLTPKTLTACWDVFCEPRVLVESGPENGTYQVLLPDGRSIRVSESDVVRRRPERTERQARPRPRPQFDGAEEVPLW
ncbi:hypothetical protein [Actinoplanes sp. NPDC051859]|uniref:hypothetical protein n=1 Tax=Actinoplanes sp. NPDC051859 TaxID=3363909 RepID=UPI003798F545